MDDRGDLGGWHGHRIGVGAVQENTLIMYLVGDNGASAEGGMVGMFNEMTYFNGVQETVAEQLKNIDKWGGPETFPHMAAGWAVAGNTPFMWTKQVASNFGGTRNPLVVHWPKGIKAKGQVRSQFHNVVDLAPTVLDAAGIPEPAKANGIAQTSMAGVSMKYTLDDAAAKGPPSLIVSWFRSDTRNLLRVC